MHATTDPRHRPPSTQAQAESLSHKAPGLARMLVRRFVEEVPFYALLPPEELEGDITEIVESNIRVAGWLLAEGRELDEELLSPPRLSAARRALEGVPLDAVLRAYHLGARVAWHELASGVEDARELIELTDRFFSLVERVCAAVASAYLEERQSIYGAEQEARRHLLGALLAGSDHQDLDHAAGVRIPARYAVFSLRLGRHPDESAPPPARSIATHRKLQRLQDAVEAFAGEPVLSTLDAQHATVLLALDAPGLGDEDARPAALEQLQQRLADAAGVEVTGAVSTAEVHEAGEAARQSREVAEVAHRFGYPPGLYRLQDVALQYQLTRTTAASPLLAGLLDPIADRPDLSQTLRCYLEHRLSRKATASALFIHPNTLDYRLRRVTQLTGLDVHTPDGLQQIAAALAARAAG